MFLTRKMLQKKHKMPITDENLAALCVLSNFKWKNYEVHYFKVETTKAEARHIENEQ